MTLAGTRSTKRERRGWYFYDWANSPFYSSTTTVFGALSMSPIAAADAKANITLNGDRACLNAAGETDTLHNCDVTLFGLHFPAGSVWVCFSDQTSHAVMSGQYMLEQTLHLPAARQYNPDSSPLAILSRLTGRKLV